MDTECLVAEDQSAYIHRQHCESTVMKKGAFFILLLLLTNPGFGQTKAQVIEALGKPTRETSDFDEMEEGPVL